LKCDVYFAQVLTLSIQAVQHNEHHRWE